MSRTVQQLTLNWIADFIQIHSKLDERLRRVGKVSTSSNGFEFQQQRVACVYAYECMHACISLCICAALQQLSDNQIKFFYTASHRKKPVSTPLTSEAQKKSTGRDIEMSKQRTDWTCCNPLVYFIEPNSISNCLATCHDGPGPF